MSSDLCGVCHHPINPVLEIKPKSCDNCGAPICEKCYTRSVHHADSPIGASGISGFVVLCEKCADLLPVTPTHHPYIG